MTEAPDQHSKFDIFSSALLCLICLTAINTVKYKEFDDLVSAVEEIPVSNDCDITTNVEWNWGFDWAPLGMEVILSDGNKKVFTDTSRYYEPDRIKIDHHTYSYYFPWKRSEGDLKIYSFLEMEMGYDRIRWIQVGQCESNEDSSDTFEAHKQCRQSPQSIIRCDLK